MKTPKEFLIEKYPALRDSWNILNSRDEWVAEQMKEYAKYYHQEKLKQISDVGKYFLALRNSNALHKKVK